MSQSRFSIVLVGVSALLRRPLVSRLRPAGFTARGSGGFRRSGRPSASGLPLGGLTFGLTASAFRHAPLRGCHSAGWPSGSRLPLFGMPRFGNCPRRVGSSAGRVGLRAHDFRFSTRTDSEWPLGGLAFGFTASAFRHAPIRSGRWAGWPSGSLLPLFGTHRFGVALGGLVLPLGELAFGLTTSAFRHAPLRSCRSAGWPSGLPFPLFGTHRFGIALGELTFGLPTSAFRYAPLRGCHSAGWPSGSRLLLFGMRRSAPPYRRSEGRRNTPTRHLFHFKTLIPTC